MRISDWSSDVCSSDLPGDGLHEESRGRDHRPRGSRGQTLHRRSSGRWCEDPPRQRQRWRDGGDQRSRRIGRGEDAAGDLRRTGTAVSADVPRSEEHTSELQSLMRISYAVFCLKKKIYISHTRKNTQHILTDTYIAI